MEAVSLLVSSSTRGQAARCSQAQAEKKEGAVLVDCPLMASGKTFRPQLSPEYAVDSLESVK